MHVSPRDRLNDNTITKHKAASGKFLYQQRQKSGYFDATQITTAAGASSKSVRLPAASSKLPSEQAAALRSQKQSSKELRAYSTLFPDEPPGPGAIVPRKGTMVSTKL